MKPIRAIDLCGGAGGWACAARGLPVDIVLAVDLWGDACKTYQLNFPDTAVYQADVRDPDVQAIILERCPEPVELILGGIPCEWLSPYRRLHKVKEHELDAQLATLDSVLALVQRLGPRWWCLEDVSQLAGQLPAFTPYMVLNSAEDSPQRRKRLYVGKFPPPRRGRNRSLAASCLRPGPYRIGKRLAAREFSTHATFTGRTALPICARKKAPTVIDQSSRHDAEYGVVAPHLPGGKRQLEWQEGARLQGFPEDFVFYGSPTSVGKMVGQAIQIDTGRAILEAIVEEKGKTLRTRGREESRSIAARARI